MDLCSGSATGKGPLLTLMAEGRSNAGIAGHLYLSPKSVERHIAAVFDKLGLPPEPDLGGIMTTATTQYRAKLTGQIVVVTGGSAGIGLEMARLARAAVGLGAPSSAASHVRPAAPGRFSGDLAEQTGPVMVTAAGPAVG